MLSLDIDNVKKDLARYIIFKDEINIIDIYIKSIIIKVIINIYNHYIVITFIKYTVKK